MKIPDSKKAALKAKVASSCDHESEFACGTCVKKHMFMDALADANVPVNYWLLKFKDFSGSPIIKEKTSSYISDLPDAFTNGQHLCFVGSYGTGKTYSICSILKKALMEGYSAYYTTLGDMVTYTLDFNTKDEFFDRVMKSDFLAIDEIDSRHMSESDEAQKLFGSALEKVIRYRVQNGLPMLLATNNSSLDEVFSGQHKRVMESLGSQLNVVAALGKDHRVLGKQNV